MDDAQQNAVTALREAAQALSVGDKASRDEPKVLEQNLPGLADEVAVVLEAMVSLLHQVDLDPRPRSGAGHSLHAVTQHLSAGAELARRVAAGEEFEQAPRRTLPETRHSPS